MITLKHNSGIDLSSWEQGIVIANLSFKPTFVGTRATYGANVDKTFFDIQNQTHALQVPFLAFAYFINSQSSADQAKLLWNTVKGSWMKGDKLCLDYEDRTTPFSAHAAVDFFFNLEQVSGISHTEMVAYSQASIWNSLNTKLVDWQYIKSIPFWTAGTPDNPDAFNDIPPAYIPNDMTRASNVMAWQYYPSYVDKGYSGGLDVDYIDAAFLTKWQAEYNWGSVPVVLPPVVTPPTYTVEFPLKYELIIQSDGTPSVTKQ